MMRLRPLAMALVAAASVLCAASAHAQSLQRTVFLHGLNANSGTWSWAASRLSSEFAIAATVPSLPSLQAFPTQEQDLRAMVPAGSNVVSVGHSNGGQILRLWSATENRTDRLAVLTSLNRGAPMADRALTGEILIHPVQLALDIYGTVNWYADMEFLRMGGLPVSIDQVNAWQSFINWGIQFERTISDYGFVKDALASQFLPALYWMSPTRSPLYSSNAVLGSTNPPLLNSSANLAREAASMRARVAIRGAYRDIETGQTPGDILFNTFFTQETAWKWGIARRIAYDISLALFDYYQNRYRDPRPEYMSLKHNAYMWASIASRLQTLDLWWLQMIGANLVQDPNTLRWAAEDSDGILPLSTQRLPGSTHELDYYSPRATHMKVANDPEVLLRLRTTFRNFFNIDFRADIAGSVTISPNPTSVRLSQLRYLTATVKNPAGATISRPVIWTSSNATVATVSSSGVVTPHAIGTAVVSATADGVTGSTTVSVLEALPYTGLALYGPTSVRPYCSTDTWTAVPQEFGTPGPFTYTWRVNGSVVAGAGENLNHMITETSVIEVTAIQNATGITRTASLTVDGSAIACDW